ncbi:NAD(P)-dependent dehydrogenase (short-subunit alcohol dehydrogenase family) [Crossiella equi]|uniref:NAD(P)-dependent dehydrogenase (Short-subunit alcohol dehydrogenase family) n=1 Tax=Crossiella equi TaxID=130796 RepID=A0ABS5A7T9_9PSEU|nr:SDR family oxidoreductase [Crossiella equi]MBP2472640.1 NAD(P)-dependent dehydrogenase (short-subunit alcohol dehydrogenase family) [Crossiella equi]
MDSQGRFANKVALITGGTSGIGLATAELLLHEGARVVITGRSRERLDSAARLLGSPERVLAVRADSASLPDLDLLTRQVRDRFRGLDVLFANAGTGIFKRTEEFTEEDFDALVDVNFKGVFFTIQKSLPLFRNGGAIVINSSASAHRGRAVTSLYSATKAAVQNLARTLAADLAERGIRVNSVSPGYISTDSLNVDLLGPAVAEAMRRESVQRRFGRAEEVAQAVAFLASAGASYVNGQDLLVDGAMVRSISG